MGAIHDAMTRFFEADNWTVSDLGDDSLGAVVKGKTGQWALVAQAVEDRGFFLCYSQVPVDAPVEMFSRVMEYVTRANVGALGGNFEFDLETGLVRYKTSVDVSAWSEKQRSSNAMRLLIEQAIITNVSMVDLYLPGLLETAFGGVDPSDAIARVENATA